MCLRLLLDYVMFTPVLYYIFCVSSKRFSHTGKQQSSSPVSLFSLIHLSISVRLPLEAQFEKCYVCVCACVSLAVCVHVYVCATVLRDTMIKCFE